MVILKESYLPPMGLLCCLYFPDCNLLVVETVHVCRRSIALNLVGCTGHLFSGTNCKKFHFTTLSGGLYCAVHMAVLLCHFKAFYKTIFIEFQYF